jgi:hypothetical protein
MAQLGISATADGRWQWQCSCGAAGEDASREVAREQYKNHRRKCGATQPEAKSMSTEVKKEETAAPKAPPAAKKTAAAAAPKGRKKREQSIKESDVKAVAERLKKGGTTLIAESKKLGFTHNGPLRAALRALVGEAGYTKLIEAASAGKEVKKPAAKKPAAKKKASPKVASGTTEMVNNIPPLTGEPAKEVVSS